MCVPESFCTHQNANSVKFLETGLILGIEENCYQTLGVLFIVVTIGCSLVVTKSLHYNMLKFILCSSRI